MVDNQHGDADSSLRIEADDVTLVADAFGDHRDPAVVLLHGGGQTRHSWQDTAARLGADGWYAVAVDLRGHGGSDWSPDGVYTADRFAADVTAIARSVPRRPALIGASLGGISSLLAMADDNAIATALVLVDVAPRVEAAGVQRIRRFMASGLHGFDGLEEAAAAIAAYNPHRPRPKNLSGLRKNLRQKADGRWYWHWDARMMDPPDPLERPVGLDGVPADRYASEARLSAAASRITVPTLLVRGGASDLLTRDGVDHLLGLIPHARAVDVSGAGHMVAGDNNDQFNTAIIDFLSEVRSAPPSPSPSPGGDTG
ncbi:MAG: alpha/beta fold hydrolase [Acidimicrobiales bacterium]